MFENFRSCLDKQRQRCDTDVMSIVKRGFRAVRVTQMLRLSSSIQDLSGDFSSIAVQYHDMIRAMQYLTWARGILLGRLALACRRNSLGKSLVEFSMAFKFKIAHHHDTQYSPQ